MGFSSLKCGGHRMGRLTDIERAVYGREWSSDLNSAVLNQDDRSYIEWALFAWEGPSQVQVKRVPSEAWNAPYRSPASCEMAPKLKVGRLMHKKPFHSHEGGLFLVWEEPSQALHGLSRPDMGYMALSWVMSTIWNRPPPMFTCQRTGNRLAGEERGSSLWSLLFPSSPR